MVVVFYIAWEKFFEDDSEIVETQKKLKEKIAKLEIVVEQLVEVQKITKK